MKKAVLSIVLLFVISNAFVSCTTDAYDLPEREELVIQNSDLLDDTINADTTSEGVQDTDPIVTDPKRD